MKARAHPLLPFPLVLRRMLALAGFIAVVALALLLLYRVYIHHADAGPDVEDALSLVARDVKIAAPPC